MELKISKTPLVMSVELDRNQHWLVNERILQRTIERFYPNINFVVSLPNNSFHRSIGQRISKEIAGMKDRIVLGTENPWTRLLQMIERTNQEHVLTIPQNACGMPLAGVDFIGRMIRGSDVDLVYSDQIVGLLPFLLSRRLVEKVLGKAPHANLDSGPLETLATSK